MIKHLLKSSHFNIHKVTSFFWIDLFILKGLAKNQKATFVDFLNYQMLFSVFINSYITVYTRSYLYFASI